MDDGWMAGFLVARRQARKIHLFSDGYIILMYYCRGMERAMYRVTLRNRKGNNWLAGHMARLDERRRTKRVWEWRSREDLRGCSRPPQRQDWRHPTTRKSGLDESTTRSPRVEDEGRNYGYYPLRFLSILVNVWRHDVGFERYSITYSPAE